MCTEIKEHLFNLVSAGEKETVIKKTQNGSF